MKKVAITLGLSFSLVGCGITGTPEEMAALSQSLGALGQSFQNSSQQMLYQSSTYQAPAVQSYSPARSNTYCYLNSYSVMICR